MYLCPSFVTAIAARFFIPPLMARRFQPFSATLELTDAASDGRAVARHHDWVVFVEGGVPGDLAEVYVYRKQKKHLLGRIDEILRPSPHRVAPRCQHFGSCGGCKWQHMAYEAQLQFKQQQVVNILSRIGRVDLGEVEPILGSETVYGYRNKLEFSFSNKAWRTREQMRLEETVADERVLGFYAPGFYDKVLDIDTCHLMPGAVNEIRNAVREFGRAEDWSFYDNQTHAGFLRNLAFRSSAATGELMLMLIVGEDDPAKVDQLFSYLETHFPAITQYLWIHNPKLNSSYTDLPVRIWKGAAHYTEQLGAYQFRVRPVSFFQTNPRQATRLYGLVRDYLASTLPAGQARHRLVYDLYAGTGSIGIFVSELAERIVGIEYVEAAVEDAWENVRLNGLDESRFRFLAGDMKDLLSPSLAESEGYPDVVITDPPRQGMDTKVVDRLLALRPGHIIYVSCKPATQARDLDLLSAWYEVVRIRPVDMFPHTAHVENVALLRRRAAAWTRPVRAEASALDLDTATGTAG